MKFCDIDTKEQAQELTGCDVYFSRKLSEDGREDMSLNEAETSACSTPTTTTA